MQDTDQQHLLWFVLQAFNVQVLMYKYMKVWHSIIPVDYKKVTQ